LTVITAVFLLAGMIIDVIWLHSYNGIPYLFSRCVPSICTTSWNFAKAAFICDVCIMSMSNTTYIVVVPYNKVHSELPFSNCADVLLRIYSDCILCVQWLGRLNVMTLFSQAFIITPRYLTLLLLPSRIKSLVAATSWLCKLQEMIEPSGE